ncbi:hypothetical protein F5880DRAFT_1723013 [Lentinula raphanica]|nr:hypothetical protein F5880DRAFT_1723013 [Lentinula raphanica]
MHKLPESVPALDTLLNSLRNQKTDLLHQIEKIDSDIAAAERKRAKIWNEAAFVYKLPPELLSHIFLLCQKDKPAFQLIAARVCCRWRDLAVGTPMLWTDIRVILAHQLHIQPGLDKMETYINRSGPSSLFAVRLDVEEEFEFAPFLKLIAAHISRCAHLSIRVLDYAQASSLLRQHLESLRAPHLRFLALQIDWERRSPERKMFGTPLIFKAGAPSLNHLKLAGAASGLRLPISSGITTLHLDGLHMDELTVLEYREMLAAHRCLVNLSLQWLKIDSTMSTDSDLRALELPMLRSLRIRTDEAFRSISTKALLSALPLSCLENLILYEVDNLYSFQFPNVKDLSLHSCEFPVEQLGHLILAFPSVIYLMLESEFPLLYTASGIHGGLLMSPKLQLLCLRNLGDSHDVSALLSLVQQRFRVNDPLGFVYLDSPSRRLAVDIIPTLETLTYVGHIRDHPDPWPPGADSDDPVHYDNFWEF